MAIIRDVVMPHLSEPCPAASGAGIVIAAGGPKYLRYAYASIRQLRLLCDLPVQIWHNGPAELPQELRSRFSELAVEFVDAKPVIEANRFRYHHPWNLKVLAVAYSPFRDVLLLDADCAPLVPPQRVFDTSEYRNTGALFFLDGKACRKNNNLSAYLRLVTHVPEMESGQMAIDKVRHWLPLILAKWMNQFKMFYDLEMGDKNLYAMAFAKLGQRFATSPPPTWSGYGYIHHLPDGTPAFDHCLHPKRTPGIAVPQLLTDLWAEFDQVSCPIAS